MQEAQLEGELAEALREATADPEAVNFDSLWQGVEGAIACLSYEAQLRVAGKAIAQIATVYELRAARWLTDWEEGYGDAEPMLAEGVLDGLVQKTMHLDVSSLIEQPKAKPKGKRASRGESTDSVVGVVDKAALLKMVELDLEAAKEQALAVAHGENISVWREAIAQWMSRYPAVEISLSELHQALEMPLVQVWLALLLGDYVLEQRGDFYVSDIWIKSLPKNSWKS